MNTAAKFSFNALGEALTKNPLVKKFLHERELRKMWREMKRIKAKAKANRDALITKLARMTSEEKQTAQGRRIADQVATFNRVLQEER